MVLLEMSIPQVGTKRYMVLLLFFAVKNKIYLLVGREKITGLKDDSDAGKKAVYESSSITSSSDSNEEEEISEVSSQLEMIQEKDDDSDYFVRILIDNTFLKHLDDPEYLDLSYKDLFGKLESLVKH